MASYKLYFLICAIGIIATGSCKKSDPGNSVLSASAGDNINVKTGNKVTLNGTGSSDSDGNPFEYLWKFITKPASSSAVLDDNASPTPSFIPDIQGKYRVELVVSNTTEDKDTVTVSVFNVIQVDGNYENIIPGSKVGVRDFTVACDYLIATREFTEIGGDFDSAGGNGAENISIWSAM